MSKQSKRDQGIEETGKMLLSGWTMLSNVCPICHFALMSKSGTRRCPGCLADVIYESQVDPNMINLAEAYNLVSPKDIDTMSITKLDSIKEDFKKKQDVTSSKLGTKMLQGWTLLSSVCPKQECRGTPLMSLKGENSMECVSCDCHYRLSETSGDLVIINGVQAPKENNTEGDDDDDDDDKYYDGFEHNLNSSNKSQQNAELLNEASNEISKKLLCGWSLLSEVCNGACNGDVPLMSDLNGNVVCVYCSGKAAAIAKSSLNPVNKTEVIDEAIRTDIIGSRRKNTPARYVDVPMPIATKNRLVICSERIMQLIEKSCKELENSELSCNKCINVTELIPKLICAHQSITDYLK